tara:strand:- start:134333 stop:135475 length:1143 start_codon:yes stop_codon:yes gene_type:complete
MSKFYETIVIGGGMAGMACAIKLNEAGKDVAMITEILGGKTMYDTKLDMNFGAVFYMENYHNVKQILEHGPKLMKSYGQVMCHRSASDYFPALSFRMLKNVFQLLKFKRFMKTFVKHYELYKKDCEVISVKEAMKNDPFIKDLYFKTARQLIDQLKIESAGEDLISQFVYGCTGTDVEGLNALDFCNCAQGLVMPIYKFSMNYKAIEKRIGEVVIDSVESVTKTDLGHDVITKSGKVFSCKNLVLACPARVTQKLIGLKDIRKSSQLLAYLVSGVPKRKYQKNDIHVFADTNPLIFLYNRNNGKNEYEVFSVKDIELNEYFDKYELLGKVEWPDALYVKGNVILDQAPGHGLYIAGDHNGLGMEPAAISGVYVANKIMNS